ncbi:MAG: efflux RND transporter permease subunit [Petrimonas sp.]|jgi:HAE1 family hydrophobic/amphiphilic exporter-1|uniref:efflux RND transporter permease subunit n=1 Tax=Petrimonas TaxID=307628 RepID=UPI000E928F2E|nr:efflux RND transporter permease subunit [Petrimonas sp.]NLU30701.1 efflux RND transporter permease subunit [Bacteroidales bacterium]HBC37781.1 AcrB/AcrD/AcrF family protein [Porphyromonadaceae bacterium]MDD2910597.1 efflux RND transporter permease subunit [Petrimonas sp.]MDD4014905.1 efflux RND transporter permease subunit [Petrimonas sp.]
MKLPEIGVKRPVATVMLFVAIIMLGLVSLKMLPLDIMPEMEFPSITIITIYPGASANEVEEQVTKPLETILSAAEHLSEIKSTSKENVSFIQLSYSWGSDVTSAANNARDLIELTKTKLPQAAHQPIIYKINSSMMPVLAYAVNAGVNYNGIENIVEEDIATVLRKVDGVGTVVYLGQPEREIKVSVNPQRLSAYGLSATQISTMLKADNISVPAGNINMGVYDFSVRVPGKFETVEEIGNTVLKAFNGQVIRLKDVAKVEDTFMEKEAFARNRTGEGVALMIQKQSGSNTVAVVNAVRAKMAEIQKTLPSDIQVHEIISTDEVVTQSVNNLTSSIWYALVFVTLVVLMFLREWKSSLIIFITMPVSLISAFIAMYAMGYTINIFSLMALVIAIGMVVDNAIVVLENITQHIEKGSKPKQAAIFGALEMGMAIAASTATTLVVFLPMLFMGGIVGIMFKQLAILTSVCLIVSLFTALTLTPMLSSKLLKEAPRNGKKQHRSKFYAASEKVFTKIENGYKLLLGWVVFHKSLTIVIAFAVFVLTMIVGKNIGTDYIPDFDAGTVSVVFETEVGTSARQTDSISQQILQIMLEDIPEIANEAAVSIAGQTKTGALTTVGFKEGKNVGTVLCHLTPPDKRDRTAAEIAGAIRDRVESIPQIEKCRVQGGSALAAAVTGNKRPIEIIVSGNDFNQLNAVASDLQEKMQAEKAFTDVATTVDPGKLEVQVIVDKEKASQMALNTAMVGMQVRQNLYGAESGDFSEDGNDYGIVVQYAPEHRNEVNKLKEMQVSNLLGQQIPLSAIADIVESLGPLEIQRQSQQRYVKTTADLNGVSLGEATKTAQEIIDNTEIPDGISVEIGGQVNDQKSSFSSLFLIFFLGIALVYMVMAAQFESMKDPFIILFAIPFTLVGVILAFFVTGITLSVTTFIGLIMLVGIVVNNGIVLVDYTNMLRKRNYPLRDAVMEAGRSRLRPVLMTSLTTILGMLPMAVSNGMGREMYAPLGITIIGGLLVSTLVTLLLVPAMYTSLYHRTLAKDRTTARLKKQRQAENKKSLE